MIGSRGSIGSRVCLSFSISGTIHVCSWAGLKAGMMASPSLVPGSHHTAAMETFLNII